MDTNITEKNSYTREIKVTVPWVELEPSFGRFVNRFRKSIKLPGFRKGKIPRKILFQRFMPSMEAEFAQDALEEFFIKALGDKNITPINKASIQNLDFHYDSPLTFSAEFEIEPEVELPNYKKKFKIKRDIYISDEEDIDIYIRELQQQSAELRTVDSGSKDGHLLLVDLQELDQTGVPIIGNRVKDRYIKVGEGMFGGENLDRLTGLKAGESTTIQVESKGTPDKTPYKVDVRNVQEELLPEVNEEFIRENDPDASNLSEFRKNILSIIQTKLDADAKGKFEENLIDHFIQNTTLEVPPSMVENYLDDLVENANKQQWENFNEREYRDRIKPSTIRNIKWYLIRKALISSTELNISEEEVTAKVSDLVQGVSENKRELERFYKKPSNRKRLQENLLDDKLMDYLTEFVKEQKNKIYTKDIRKLQQS